MMSSVIARSCSLSAYGTLSRHPEVRASYAPRRMMVTQHDPGRRPSRLAARAPQGDGDRSAPAARLNPLGVEHRLLAGAVAAQRALFADGVGALEYPVLPGREPGKDFRLHRFRAAEAKIRLQAGKPVRREARAFLKEDA